MTQEFRLAMLEHGLTAPDFIDAGKFYRFHSADGKYDTAGWCRLFDDQQSGVYGDWSTGLSETWIAERQTTHTPEEKAKFMQHVAEARMKAEKEREQNHEEAANKARSLWDSLPIAQNNHPYLMRKNINPHNIKTHNGDLVVPVYVNEFLSTLQYIKSDGSKKFLSGGRVQAGYYFIGDLSTVEVICITEGFATAATIYETTNFTTIIAFSAGNIKPVALTMRSRYPNHTIIICADDDALTKGNPGVKSAMEAAIAIDGKIAIPTFGEIRPDGVTDFNDMAAYLGADAVAKCINAQLSYKPETDIESKPKIEPGVTRGFLTHAEVADLFKDCIYITMEDKILFKTVEIIEDEEIQIARLLTPKQFDSKFGGRRFPLDAAYKKWTQYASEALVHSTELNKKEADRTWLNPKQEFGKIGFDGKNHVVNKFIPAKVKRIKGDATPFLNHMAKLFPNENDRKIMMCYMAALVQNPGVKFKWCPFIQGVEGNGKGTLSEFIAYAVGPHYCTNLMPQQLEKEFNSWLLENIVIFIHDVFVPEDRAAVYERLKTLITEEKQSIRQMRTDPYNALVYCNWIMFSQHLDAIRKTNNDRRYAVFSTPQQHAEDLLKWGLTPEYFSKFHAWKDADGFAIVSDFLFTYDLSNVPFLYNPALGGKAPFTTSESMAIEYSYSLVEQAILDVIDEGETYGAKGNFISTVAIENILARIGRSKVLKGSKRTDILRVLGYVLHPALTKGRVTRVLAHEGKPHIYVLKTSPEYLIESGSEATDAYFRAQQL